MKKYFMSVGTGKVHSLTRANGTCKNKIHKENYREFSSLKEIKNLSEKRITLCKICMREEEDAWKKICEKIS